MKPMAICWNIDKAHNKPTNESNSTENSLELIRS